MFTAANRVVFAISEWKVIMWKWSIETTATASHERRNSSLFLQLLVTRTNRFQECAVRVKMRSPISYSGKKEKQTRKNGVKKSLPFLWYMRMMLLLLLLMPKLLLSIKVQKHIRFVLVRERARATIFVVGIVANFFFFVFLYYAHSIIFIVFRIILWDFLLQLACIAWLSNLFVLCTLFRLWNNDEKRKTTSMLMLTCCWPFFLALSLSISCAVFSHLATETRPLLCTEWRNRLCINSSVKITEHIIRKRGTFRTQNFSKKSLSLAFFLLSSVIV